MWWRNSSLVVVMGLKFVCPRLPCLLVLYPASNWVISLFELNLIYVGKLQ